MSKGPEATLVAKIKQAVLDAWPGSFVTKTHGGPYTPVGMPDLLVVVKGMLVAFEVKAPRENESDAQVLARVTPLQAETLKKLREAGAVAEVVWTVDQVLDVLNRCVPKVDREEVSRDVRLYALAEAEDKLRKQLEALEGEIYELRIENDRMRVSR